MRGDNDDEKGQTGDSETFGSPVGVSLQMRLPRSLELPQPEFRGVSALHILFCQCEPAMRLK